MARKRGPKSAAEKLTPVPTALPERPRPPERLRAEDRARWRVLVNELPVDRFRASDLEMLAELVITERYVRECNEVIDSDGHFAGDGIHPAVVLREKYTRVMVALQRALRLCPSMRMRHESGKLKDTTRRKKPWEA